MELKIVNDFNIPLDWLWDFTLSDEYFKSIPPQMNLAVYEPRVIKKEKDHTYFEIHCEPKVAVPGVLQKVLGGKTYCQTEKQKKYHAGYTIDFDVVQSIISPDKVKARGTVKLESTGKNKSRRVIVAEMEVRIPLIGKTIEKFVASTVTDSYNLNAKAIEEWYKKHK